MQKSAIKISPVNMEERQRLELSSGDTVRVWQKIEEKGKTRRQAFEGVILSVKHGNEAGATFTVRKVASGVGVEKIFPLYSPMIDSIELVKRARMRRAKLYFIRFKAARDAKRQMRRARFVTPAELAAMAEAPAREEEVVPEVVEEVIEETTSPMEETVTEEVAVPETVQEKPAEAAAE